MARRGFFAELHRISKRAAKEHARTQRDAARRHAHAVRQFELAQRASERSQAQMARADEAERKRMERQAKDAYLDSREAEVEELNAALEEVSEEIGSLLSSTLGVDDYVDLATLRQVAEHPPFSRPDLEQALARPAEVPLPPEPQLQLADEPTGILSFLRKGKHDAAVAAAKAAHEEDIKSWRTEARTVLMKRKRADAEWNEQETRRLQALQEARQRYEEECRAREREVAQSNRDLDELIDNLSYGAAEAVREYISIVLSNSVYPEQFPVRYDATFEPSTAELALHVVVPNPDTLSEVRSYKYSKGTDEIVPSPMSQKELRERYASAVHQVALRSLHEVFESDRHGLIKTIALDVSVHAADPATGKHGPISLVVAGAERHAYLALNLAAVVPAVTLEHLGAAVSKNPYALAGVRKAGVRRS